MEPFIAFLNVLRENGADVRTTVQKLEKFRVKDNISMSQSQTVATNIALMRKMAEKD
jgi:hypothetical protein